VRPKSDKAAWFDESYFYFTIESGSGVKFEITASFPENKMGDVRVKE
jgi:hypothetical protein